MVGQQSSDREINDKHDVAAIAAIPAIRSTEWLELLAVHRGTTMPTVTALNVENHAVNECCHCVLLQVLSSVLR
jgi:hypothetical protein